MDDNQDSDLIIIRVPKEFKKKIRQKAKQNGYTTMSNYIRSVLRESIEIPSSYKAARKSGDGGSAMWANSMPRPEDGYMEGLVMVDAKTKIIQLVDKNYARMHGYDVNELIGKYLFDMFSSVSLKSIERHIQFIEKEDSHVFIAMHKRKDGSEFKVLIEVRHIKDDDDKTISFVGRVRTIAESLNR